MKLTRFLLPLGAAAAVFMTSTLFAETPPMTGDELLHAVRLSQAAQDLHHLKGKLRNDNTGATYPIELTIASGSIRFLLRNPNEIINLDLNNKSAVLTRINANGKTEVSPSLYAEHVRGTDINFEDLSMRFLYWPNAKIIGSESLSLQKCWIARATNPDGRGPYATVDMWVDGKTGALMKMEAYNAQGQKVKRFMVRKGQRYKGAYILREMQVETFNPAKPGDVAGRTYMDIDPPE